MRTARSRKVKENQKVLFTKFSSEFYWCTVEHIDGNKVYLKNLLNPEAKLMSTTVLSKIKLIPEEVLCQH